MSTMLARALRVALFTLLTAPAHAAADMDESVALVDALRGVYGERPDLRPSHARGLCARGMFTPSPGAGELSRARPFQGAPLPARLRFSVAGGNPAVSDAARSPRGLAIRLGDGPGLYDLVLISEPVFFAASRASFLSFFDARRPDPATGQPDPAKLAAHAQRYPESQTQARLLASHAAPRAYTSATYFANHAFLFTNADGHTRPARLWLRPLDGEQRLSEADALRLGPRFLDASLRQRLSAGPAEFELQAQLPAPGDDIDNPTALWQGQPRMLALGRLRVDALDGDVCDALVYLPTRLPAGIAAGADPMLHLRAPAYQSSWLDRTGAPLPGQAEHAHR